MTEMEHLNAIARHLSVPGISVYPIDQAERLFVELERWRSGAGGGEIETRRQALVFRDCDGRYWTMTPDAGAWLVYLNATWMPMRRPEGPLEGPQDAGLPLERFDVTEPDPVSERGSDATGEGPSGTPPEPTPEAYQALIRDTYQDYRDGLYGSEAATLLLQAHLAIDKNHTLWNVGCRTGTWYRFADGVWSASDTAPEFPAPPGADGAEAGPGEAGALALIAFLRSGASSLPEPVSDPWDPPDPPDLPEVPDRDSAAIEPAGPETPPLPDSAICLACGATLKPDQEFCTQCGNAVGPANEAAVPPSVPACAQCGSELEAGTRFCTQCGHPV